MVINRYGAYRLVRNAIAAVVLLAGAAQAQTVTIAALGDSLTQGYGLPVDDGFVPQLEQWLSDQGADVAVLNAGVSGDTTAGGLSRVGWTLSPDVDAMIVTLGGNDLLRGIDPAVSRANLDGIMQAAQDAQIPVLLVGMQASNNYGPDYKAAFDSMYPELASEYDALYYPSFLGPLVEEGDVAAARAFFQPDGIHPNSEGVAVIVDAMGPTVLDLIDKVDE
nr:arylesterase [Marivivens niveibacter]